MAYVKINQLVKRYGEHTVLDHLSLTINEGEVFGLLGPNGSGKTTLINCMLAILSYEKGDIEIMGKPMTPAAYDVKSQIGIVMQNVAVIDELSVRENIDYFCSLYVRDKKRRQAYVREAIDFVELGDYAGYHPKKLSGGLLRRLNIACGIAHKPRLLILDEPTVAVDPQSRNKILEGITRLNQEGTTIIYTSHYMEEVDQICSRIAILDQGKTVAIGTSRELKEMISKEDKINIEVFQFSEAHRKGMLHLDNVLEVKWENESIEVSTQGCESSLIDVIGYLRTHEIPYGRVYTERPTLNDVFLEITGKNLRD